MNVIRGFPFNHIIFLPALNISVPAARLRLLIIAKFFQPADLQRPTKADDFISFRQTNIVVCFFDAIKINLTEIEKPNGKSH